MTTTGISKLLSTVFLLIGLVAVVEFADAQVPWASDPSLQARMTQYDSQLTAEQIQELERVRAAYQEQALLLEKGLESKSIELDALMSQPQIDLNRVMSLRREMRELEGELDDLRFETKVQASQMLPPDQRARAGYTEDLLAGHDRWSCHSGCYWHGHSSGRGLHYRSTARWRGHCC